MGGAGGGGGAGGAVVTNDRCFMHTKTDLETLMYVGCKKKFYEEIGGQYLQENVAHDRQSLVCFDIKCTPCNQVCRKRT